MKKIRKTWLGVMLLYALLCLLLFVSCRSQPVILAETKEVKEIVRDTIFRTEKDSAFYEAYIECKEGKAFISNLSQKGENKGKILANAQVKDNKLTLKVEKPPEELRAKVIHKQTTLKQPQILYKEKAFKWYHTALMWAGGIFILTIICAIASYYKR